MPFFLKEPDVPIEPRLIAECLHDTIKTMLRWQVTNRRYVFKASILLMGGRRNFEFCVSRNTVTRIFYELAQLAVNKTPKFHQARIKSAQVKLSAIQ